jgi:purine-cytosine permease-like protein
MRDIEYLFGCLLGFALNIFLQVLLYRWLTIRLILSGDKDKLKKNKVPFYVLFVFMGIIVYLLVAKNT